MCKALVGVVSGIGVLAIITMDEVGLRNIL